MGEKPDIIAWPEYAIPADVFFKKDLWEKITAAARQTRSSIVLGTLAELGGIINGEERILNIAALISPQPENKPHAKYVSVRPAPFEKTTIAGSAIHTLATEKTNLGVLLCFEGSRRKRIARPLRLCQRRIYFCGIRKHGHSFWR